MAPIRKSWGAKITTSLLQNEKQLRRIFIIYKVLGLSLWTTACWIWSIGRVELVRVPDLCFDLSHLWRWSWTIFGASCAQNEVEENMVSISPEIPKIMWYLRTLTRSSKYLDWRLNSISIWICIIVQFHPITYINCRLMGEGQVFCLKLKWVPQSSVWKFGN